MSTATLEKPIESKAEGLSLSVDKIKLTDKRGKVSIDWTVGESSYSLESREVPSPEFLDALNALLPIVIETCVLDQKAWERAALEDEAYVSGVTLKHDPIGLGAIITAQFKAEAGYVVVINTPLLKPEWLGPSEQSLLRQVEIEALNYIKGERAQMTLDLGV